MTQTLTIPEAAKALNVSDKTIRRWIDVGKLTAEKGDRKWSVYVDLDIDLDNDLDVEKDTDRTDVQHFKAQLDRADSEISHLREQLARRDEQIDHLTQLLAMQTKTTAALTERLQASKDMRRRSWWKRVFSRGSIHGMGARKSAAVTMGMP